MEEYVITEQEAMEYAEFKRQKRVADAKQLLTRIECDLTKIRREELKKAVLSCKAGGFGYLRVSPIQVRFVKEFGFPMPVVCKTEEVDSDLKTKLTAVRSVLRSGADEVVVSLSSLSAGDPTYLRKEVKRIKRVLKGKKVCFSIPSGFGERAILSGERIATDASPANQRTPLAVTEGVFTAEQFKKTLETSERICTREYEKLADELLAQANRAEPVGRKNENLDESTKE
ncbi:MAG: hypothetical protein ACI4U2_06465 [Christensenellaceae bacterium]